MEATAVPTTVHVYYEVQERTAVPYFVGDIDIVLTDRDGIIVGMTDVTADRLPVSDLLSAVNAQLAVFAALAVETDDRTPVVQYRNFDGRVGYMAPAGVRILESVR